MLVLLSLLLLPAGKGLQAQVDFDGLFLKPESGVSIKVQSLYDGFPRSGFLPIHIAIENNTRNTLAWNFKFQIPAYGNNSLSHALRMEVPGGRKAERWVYLPLGEMGSALGDRYEQVVCQVTGPGVQSGSMRAAMENKAYQGTGLVLLSERVGQVNGSAVNDVLEKKEQPKRSRSGWTETLFEERLNRWGKREISLNHTVLDLRRIPADARSWAGVEALWLESKDWQELEPAQQEILQNWVWAGGVLYLLHTPEEGRGLSLGHWGFADEGKEPLGFGLGRVHPISWSQGVLDAKEAAAEMYDLLTNPAQPCSEDFEENNWRRRYDLGKFPVPTLWIVVSVLAFVALVGPLNLWWLAARQRRHLIFISTPLLSLFTVLLLGLAILGYDGMGGTGVRSALVLLSGGQMPAVVTQEQASRCSFLLKRSFPVEEQAVLAYLPKSGEPGNRFERSVDEARGDWFSSRAVKAHFLKYSLPSRAGVEHGSAGSGSLISRIPATLEVLYFLDQEGTWWKTGRLRTGESVPLQKVEEKEFEDWLKTSLNDTSLNLQFLAQSVAGRRGYFYALSRGQTPGADFSVPVDTLDSIRWKDDLVLYLGPVGGEK
ncbi:MAG: hypothetical protein HC904_08830 [Blastochloris sp.]|nr:hypothetical protein [Blastochloris sp.]